MVTPTVEQIAISDSSPIRNMQLAMRELLRNNVSLVSKRVYPPGIRQDAQMPRICVSALTPTEQRVGLGERFGKGMGLWRICTFKVDVFDKDPTRCELVADQICNVVWKNRGYTPSVSTFGYFVNLEVSGGSGTSLNSALQLYQRTINITGRWIELTSSTGFQ